MSEIVQNIIAKGAQLDALKQRINEEHRRCEEAVGSALEHAINAGEGLVQMKDNLSHGTWGRWLRENFEGSERTAQAYMRLYRRRDEIRNGAADLSIRGALSSLSVPKPEPVETVEEATVPSIPAKAVAEAYGTSVEAIRSGRYKNETREVRNAIADEQERREARGESFDAEERAEHARKVAEMKKRSREAAERHRAEQRKRHGEMFLDVDADVSKARRAIKSALEKIKDGDIPFDDEEVELLERENAALQDTARLFGAALTGDSGTDWDAELYELEQRRQWGAEGEAE